MKKVAALIGLLISLFTVISYAQMTYGDRRSQADNDPSTMRARSYFRRLMADNHKKYQAQLGLNDLQLDFNHRMIAQYARGAESAYEVIPKEHFEIMKFISDCRTKASSVLDSAMNTSLKNKYSDAELRQAISRLAHTKKIYLDYWGYIGRTFRPPAYIQKTATLTQFVTWHEADSYYEATPSGRLRFLIMKAALKPQTGFWDSFVGH